MPGLKEKIRQTVRDHLPALVSSTLIVLFLVALLFNRIFVTVPAGSAGVLWLRFFGGTVIDEVYGEGVHFIMPWDKMFVYDMRVQELSRNFTVLTNSGLQVEVWVSVRYYPEYGLLGALHQQVGPEYATRVIVPTVESVVRSVVGRLDDRQIYASSAILAKSVTESTELMARRFINIDAVLVTKVVLPDSIQQIIQYKIEQMHRLEAYKYILDKETKEAERKRIEAQGLASYNSILQASLTPDILRYKGIQATEGLAASQNAKVVVVGGGKDGLPLILGTDR